MDDRPAASESQPLIDSSQDYPPREQRAAAWKGEFRNETGAFQGAFKHAAIGMALVDLDGRFLKVNRSLCQVVGFSEEDLLATDFQSITHPDDLAADLSLAAQVMRGEIDHYQMEKRYFHKQGHAIWILLSVSMARDEQGHPCYFISQIQDISARKAAQLESARRLRHVERLTQTVSGILNVLERTPDDQVYFDVLSIVLDSFHSRAGLFLRFGDDGALVGPYFSDQERVVVRCQPHNQCELWDNALAGDAAIIENSPRWMGCGELISRSLVAPIRHHGALIGLIHVGDCQSDYHADDQDLLTRISSMIAPVISARMEVGKLTPREAEVMDLIVSGKTQKQIAAELDVSVQTAAKHRARILEKLDVRNDVELVHLAFRMRNPPARAQRAS